MEKRMRGLILTDAEKKPFLWLVSLCMGILLFASPQHTILLHELGHVIFGFGTMVSPTRTMVSFEWYGSIIAGSAFPMLLYAWVGYKLRPWFPPLWAAGAVFGWFGNGLEYNGDYYGGADYSYHDPAYMIGFAVCLILCLWIMARPWRLPKYVYHVSFKDNSITRTQRSDRCPTRPSRRRSCKA